MKHPSSALDRALIRVTYLMPAVFGLILLILFFVPHVFFTFNGTLQPTYSPFDLMCNTWEATLPVLSASAQSSSASYFFSLIMIIVTLLSWIAVFVYTSMAIASAICSSIAFSCAPTERLANRAKRWMQFFCPGRVMYVISNLLLLLPAAFCHLLAYCYRTQLGYDVKVYFIGASDLLLAAIFVLLNVAAFLALLPAQAREQMDLYRIVKSQKEKDLE